MLSRPADAVAQPEQQPRNEAPLALVPAVSGSSEHGGEDAGSRGTEKGAGPENSSPDERDSRLNERRLAAAPVAGSIFADACDSLHGEVKQALGVSYQTVDKWCKGERPITLRDILACGPTVAARVGRGLKAYAAGQKVRRAPISIKSAALRVGAATGQLQAEVEAATSKASPGGKRITPSERAALLKRLEAERARLDELEQALRVTEEEPVPQE